MAMANVDNSSVQRELLRQLACFQGQKPLWLDSTFIRGTVWTFAMTLS